MITEKFNFRKSHLRKSTSYAKPSTMVFQVHMFISFLSKGNIACFAKCKAATLCSNPVPHEMSYVAQAGLECSAETIFMRAQWLRSKCTRGHFVHAVWKLFQVCEIRQETNKCMAPLCWTFMSKEIYLECSLAACAHLISVIIFCF